MVTFTSRADIEAALADPLLVPPPVESGPEGSMAWLRAAVARFSHGEVHARRRAYVVAEVARIDAGELRRLAADGAFGTGDAFGDDRTRVLRALAEAMGLPRFGDAALGALRTVADNYFGGDDPAADDAVRLLLPLIREQLMDQVRGFFPPEFVNRLDEVVIFHSLGKPEMGTIVDLMLDSSRRRLKAQELGLEVTERAKDWLVERGYQPEFGARPLRRTIQAELDTKVASLLLAGDTTPGDTIVADEADDHLVCRVRHVGAGG